MNKEKCFSATATDPFGTAERKAIMAMFEIRLMGMSLKNLDAICHNAGLDVIRQDGETFIPTAGAAKPLPKAAMVMAASVDVALPSWATLELKRAMA